MGHQWVQSLIGEPGRIKLQGRTLYTQSSLVDKNLIAVLDNCYLDQRYRHTDCDDVEARSLRSLFPMFTAPTEGNLATGNGIVTGGWGLGAGLGEEAGSV